jgi:hypothetical protein
LRAPEVAGWACALNINSAIILSEKLRLYPCNTPMATTPHQLTMPQSSRRAMPRVREQEILRISASFAGEDLRLSLREARNQVLRWAQNKVIGTLPDTAWQFTDFDLFSSGRNCSAVRINDTAFDIWSLRIEDPDKTVASRAWATEITTTYDPLQLEARLTLRLLVGTPELTLDIQPSVPGVIRQIIQSPGLWADKYKLTDKPLIIRSKTGLDLLVRALLDSSRKLPIIILSVPAEAADPFIPPLNANTLAQACAGLAIVAILPSELSRRLTDRFGKRLSVYEGAARVYLPGFTEDANPFGGHELILPDRFHTPSMADLAKTQLCWIAASGSVRRLRLGVDILSFASLRSHGLERRQAELREAGATEREQLEAAQNQIVMLKEQIEEAEKYQQEFSNLHAQAEERAEAAETQQRASSFRIQQLLDQLKAVGAIPDERIQLPDNWNDFANWCDINLAGRVILTPQSRRGLRSPLFGDIELAAKCLLWLANDYRVFKLSSETGTLRDVVIAPGVVNAHCGTDVFKIDWQSSSHDVEWHIKKGGNTRDPARCLRIYYFWDESSQQVVIASMPAHRRTDAS